MPMVGTFTAAICSAVGPAGRAAGAEAVWTGGRRAEMSSVLVPFHCRVLLRVKVMPLPAEPAEQAALNRRLLELNASDMLHGSYGIDQDNVVLTEALELAHLDFEEFLASYESMTLSLTSHLRELAAFREAR